LVLAGHASTPAAWVHRPIQAAENSQYRLVENWVHFPPEVTKWGQATGVDVDSHDNVFVFSPQRAHADHGVRQARQLHPRVGPRHVQDDSLSPGRSLGRDLGDRSRLHGGLQVQPEGTLLLTLGKQDVLGDNTSHDTFNGMADLAVTKNGDIVVADGEGPNTRVAKFAKRRQRSSSGGAARERSPVNSTCRTASRLTHATAFMSPTDRTTACRFSTKTASS
jgi:hypothetical protein